MERRYENIKTVRVPDGNYVSKVDAAEWLGIEVTSLQHHVKVGNIRTVRCPTGCHMILEKDLLEFAEVTRGPGKPKIDYPYKRDNNH